MFLFKASAKQTTLKLVTLLAVCFLFQPSASCDDHIPHYSFNLRLSFCCCSSEARVASSSNRSFTSTHFFPNTLLCFLCVLPPQFHILQLLMYFFNSQYSCLTVVQEYGPYVFKIWFYLWLHSSNVSIRSHSSFLNHRRHFLKFLIQILTHL